MSLTSPEFFLLLLLTLAIYFPHPHAGGRRILFTLCSLGFLQTYLTNVQSWIALALFLMSGYVIAGVLRRRPIRGVLPAYIILLVLVFALIKKYAFLHFLTPSSTMDFGIQIVGLSYILFRQIQFVVDSKEGQVENPTLLSYVNFQLNPLTLLAGPIPRYQDFQAYWNDPIPLFTNAHEILKAYCRLFLGILKMVIVSKLFHDQYTTYLERLEPPGSALPLTGARAAWTLALMLYCYIFFLYANFSGYCDLVIAAGSLLGYKIPENFNYPFLARNILDYWSRWHITLGHWIRDYLFTPIYKGGATRFPAHTSAVAVFGYFVAFTVAGVWHGSTWNFLVYGLLHGIGIRRPNFGKTYSLSAGADPACERI